MITITANARRATFKSDDLITSGSVGIPVEFVLSDDFDGLSSVAVFEGSGATVDVALMSNTCEVPPEVVATPGGYLRIGVYARNSEGTIVIPTVWVSTQVILPGAEPSGVDPSQPTPDWTAQVQEAAADALETANNVLNMSVEADTLTAGSEASVEKTIDPDGAVTLTFGIPRGNRGEQGPQGERGLQGEVGPAGPAGPQGIQGVQGERGPQGIQGIQGPQGERGETGPAGPQGERGETGEQGPQGVQGETGPKGDTGATGPAGPQGPKGDPGEVTQAEFDDLKSQMDDLQTDVSVLIKNAIESPDVLQKIVATGHIADYLSVGDVITIPWTDNGGDAPVTYQYPFVVVNIADVYDSNNIKHENALWLMAMYGTPRDIAFDAAESTPVDLTEEPNAMEGWYYWGVNGSTYTALNLSTGDPIPTTYASVVKCGINNVSVLRYGYNRWRDSAYRQWLNSDAEKNEGWWTEQHMGDRPPATTRRNLPGWLNGFTEEWRAIFKPVKVDTACNTVTDGGVTDTTYDTFFLPSVEQMYGAPQASGVEGEYWPYWKEETGLDAPTNGSSSDTNDARKIPSIANPTGSAVVCRLRSANRDNSYYVWVVVAAGFLSSTSAINSYSVLPACVIY